VPGNPLVRFDEGSVGRTPRVSPSLLRYRDPTLPGRLQFRLQSPSEFAGGPLIRLPNAPDPLLLQQELRSRKTLHERRCVLPPALPAIRPPTRNLNTTASGRI
jgi:hypothetical protein